MTAETTPASIEMLEARIDKLTQALFHVASELWVSRDRQAVLERLLIEAGVVTSASIDTRPEAALVETLNAEREAFVSRILDYLAPGR